MSLYEAQKRIVFTMEQSPACRLTKATLSLYAGGRHDASQACIFCRLHQAHKVLQGFCHRADLLGVNTPQTDAQALLRFTSEFEILRVQKGLATIACMPFSDGSNM